MPNLDGYATAQKLRSISYNGPIIALTADAMQSDMKRCLDVGCNDYLSKPINKAQLLAKVAELTIGGNKCSFVLLRNRGTGAGKHILNAPNLAC